jgi:hypothetical protein
MANPIRISGDVDLEKLLTGLSHDVVRAPAFLRLYKALEAKFREHQKEVNLSPFFWSLTRDAIKEAGLVRLARIYDQQKSALSLRTLLLTVRDNPKLFKDDAVKKRVNSDYAKEMRLGSHAPDPEDIKAHLKLVSHDEPLVKKIVEWRNTLGAHISPQRLLKETEGAVYPLTLDDAFNLCSRAYDVFNHYTSLFHSVSYARMIIGEEGSIDIVFKYLRMGREEYLRKVDEEFSRLRARAPRSGKRKDVDSA